MVLSRNSDLAQQLEAVRVEHIDNVIASVDHIKEPILSIDRKPARTGEYVRAESRFLLMLLVEDQHLAELVIAHEHPAVIVERDPNDLAKVRLFPVANQLGLMSFGVEDENRANALVSRVNIAFIVGCHAVRVDQLIRDLVLVDLLVLRLSPSEAIHPFLFWLPLAFVEHV